MTQLTRIIICVVSLFICSVAITSVNWLMSLEPTIQQVSQQEFLQGKVLSIYKSAEFWSSYPEFSPIVKLGSLIAFKPFVFMAALLLAGWILFRLMNKESLLAMGIYSLIVGLTGWIVGLVKLSGNLIPEVAGPGIHFMLLSIFYASVACFIFVAIDFGINRYYQKFSHFHTKPGLFA